MAFRFDRQNQKQKQKQNSRNPNSNPNPNPSLSSDPGNASGRDHGVGGRAEVKGSLSFVIHQHRAALSGGDGSRGGEGGGSGLVLVVPNSLSVRLEPDGEGGGHVSVR